VLRDRDTNGDGSLDERLYATMDYFNGTAVLNTSGVVQERYAYSAFGVRRIMAADFSSRPTSSFAWDFGFQGQFRDAETGWYNYGYRFYVPLLGRWINRDPIGESGGDNLYDFVKASTFNHVDSLGLTKGGKQNISVGHKGKTFTRTSNPKEISDAIDEAIRECMNKRHVKALRGILKVAQRGGTFGIAMTVLAPTAVNAGENDLLEQGRREETGVVQCNLIDQREHDCIYECTTKCGLKFKESKIRPKNPPDDCDCEPSFETEYSDLPIPDFPRHFYN
jgi:RHS repeat-associated protein